MPTRPITLRPGESIRFRCRNRIIVVRCRRRRTVM
jgi:hypothetical protein